MNCRIAIIITASLLYGNLPQTVSSQDEDAVVQKTVFMDGVVRDRKKYSFTVQGPDKSHKIKLDSLTSVAVRLIRPKFDFENKKVSVAIPGSAPDGRSKNNIKVTYELPAKIYFRNQFHSVAAMENAMAQEPIELESITLSRSPLAAGLVRSEKPTLSGELILTGETGQFQTEFNGEIKSLRPKFDTVAMEGFSITDLAPGATEVFVNGIQDEDGIVAKRVEFVRKVNPQLIFSGEQPKCLLIGDTVSFNYLAALIKELGDEVKIHHPNTNCQGSDSYKKLHRWLGLYDDPKFSWDVIAFNFGHADFSMSKANYQSNLRKCVEKLKMTGASLIWIDSTPIPYGYHDPKLKPGELIPAAKRFDFEFEESATDKLLPGRMRAQNRWAHEVLADYPEIKTCKIFDVVKGNSSQRFGEWWYGKSLNFKYPQSLPIAKEIAKSIRDAAKR